MKIKQNYKYTERAQTYMFIVYNLYYSLFIIISQYHN